MFLVSMVGGRICVLVVCLFQHNLSLSGSHPNQPLFGGCHYKMAGCFWVGCNSLHFSGFFTVESPIVGSPK